jgi:16S rRNA C967 or C1407 C5-methylase (RsmB/RsmF family)
MNPLQANRFQEAAPIGMHAAHTISSTRLQRRERPGRAFRLVCDKERISGVEALLTDQGYALAPEPLTEWARVLTSEPQPLGSSLAAFFGYLYIQDRSSLLPPLILAPEPGSMVLDLCASPGGKTGFLAQMVGKRGLVVANEPNPARHETLRRNLRQLNLLNVVTCRYPGEELPFASESVSHILLDAPCSGWGTVERHPRIREIWTGEKIGTLVHMQRRLLARAVELLSPGGKLVYSTCTTTEEENEEQIRWAVGQLGVNAMRLSPPKGIAVSVGAEGIRVIGDATAQGFFISLLTKEGMKRESPGDGGLEAKRFEPDRHSLAGAAWENLPPGEIGIFGDRLHLLHEQALQRIPRQLSWKGPLLGRLTGGKVRPDPRLRALLPDEPMAGAQLLEERTPAERLLSGQRIDCGTGGPWAGLYWRGLPLCWLKRQGRNCLWTDR